MQATKRPLGQGKAQTGIALFGISAKCLDAAFFFGGQGGQSQPLAAHGGGRCADGTPSPGSA